MNKGAQRGPTKRLRRALGAIFSSAIAVGSTVDAHPSNNLVFVAPTDLAELARLPGEAMFLGDVNDGRAVLYVEQNQGAQLSIFDVTDPKHVKSQGSVQLSVSGPFDFISSLGSQKEIVRFREDHKVAMLDFHSVTLPILTQLPEVDLRGPISPLGREGFIVNGAAAASQAVKDTESTGHYKVFDAAHIELDRAFEVKQVRATVTKPDTGTTFLLTEEGLYLIRQPAAESEKKRRDEQWFWQHNGD